MLRFPRSNRPSSGALLALLCLLLVTTLAVNTSIAAPTSPSAPTPSTTAQPTNTTSAATSAIPDRRSARPYTLTQPFPSTAALSTTISTLAAELRALPQPLTPPDGALDAAELLGGQPGAAPWLSEQNTHHIFLPSMTKSNGATPPPPPPSPADVALTLVATPSIRVARGGTLVYELRAVNYGQGTAKGARVTLPYNRQQVTLTNASFVSGSGDWVSAIAENSITVTLGPLAPGEKRSGYLYQRVGTALPDNTVISVRAAYSWSDNGSGGADSSNWTPLLVGAGNDTSAYLWLAVSPASGKPGTIHHFYSDRFSPGEGVVTWLNTPGGVRPLDLRTTADGDGRIWLDFASTGLTPGSYSLVAAGARSGLTAVSGFVVQP